MYFEETEWKNVNWIDFSRMGTSGKLLWKQKWTSGSIKCGNDLSFLGVYKIPLPVNRRLQLDIRGSVHHSTIHIEKSNKMRQCIRMYYSILIWSSTCFERHIAHHQKPKTALAASGLHTWKVAGRVFDGRCPTTIRPTTFRVCKTIGFWCSFRLLMMGGVSPETCWASYKYGIKNFDKLLHLVGFFYTKKTLFGTYLDNSWFLTSAVTQTKPALFWGIRQWISPNEA
jgi:hypothetical protein